ncbi:MAG: small multi-drug export protein [Patescibacteria group bacterium]|jgi:uncharacterized membrane protein
MQIPSEIIVAILAALPLTELRVSIPLGLTIYNLPAWSAFLWSVLGNSLVTLLILWFIGPIADFAAKHILWLKKILDWIFARTRDKAGQNFIKYGQWFLVIFVAIPLPGTGAWTGALIAFLFNIPKWRAWLLNTLGIIGAGIIVTLVSIGAIKGFDFFIK